jgi:hypothetical protein
MRSAADEARLTVMPVLLQMHISGPTEAAMKRRG